MTVEEVLPSKARELISSHHDLVILDVRAREDYAKGYIEGAISLALADLPVRMFDLDPDKPTLVYCYSGSTSQGACSQLEEHGFVVVYHLHGGFKSWLKEGLPISRLSK